MNSHEVSPNGTELIGFFFKIILLGHTDILNISVNNSQTFSTVSGDGADSPRTFLNAASLRPGGGPLNVGSELADPDAA